MNMFTYRRAYLLIIISIILPTEISTKCTKMPCIQVKIKFALGVFTFAGVCVQCEQNKKRSL